MKKDAPTLFISHSTAGLPQDDVSVKLLDALNARLGEQGWNVFIDRNTVRPGDKWREEILYNLATCQAAIILLNQKACQSEWVKQESLILSFRKSQCRDFPVIPVIFSDVKLDESFLQTYEPFQLNEIQRASVDVGENIAVDEMADSLAKSPCLEQAITLAAPISPWVISVIELIENLNNSALLRAADAAKIDIAKNMRDCFSKNQQKDRLVHSLAQHMHHVSPLDCCFAVDQLAGPLGSGQTSRLKENMLAKWVDNESIELISLFIENNNPMRALTLNTTSDEVARRYAKRIKIELTGQKFIHIVSISPPAGDFESDSLLPHINAEILRALRPNAGNEDDEQRHAINSVNEWLEKGEDVLICLLHFQTANDEALLRAIKARYPKAITIKLTNHSNAKQSSDLFVQIKPILTSDKLDQYDILASRLNTI